MTPPGRRPTLADIARETGLSTAAVSYALRGLQVPEETQERVREVADRLGYTVNPIARALSSGRTDTIGLLCGSLEDSWQRAVTAALVQALPETGRQAVIMDAGSDPAVQLALAQRLVETRADAIVVMPLDPAAQEWSDVADRATVVAIGDGLPAARTAAEIVYDNVAGVTDGLGQLAAAGHERVDVLSPIGLDTPDRPAEAVVARVSAELGVSARVVQSPHELDAACAVVRAELAGDDPPTAFLCLADSMAWGVYAAGRELGLSIPDDISVIGYDDAPVSRLLVPPLTTYHWPMDRLVDAVTRTLERAIDEGTRSRRQVISPTPVPGGSVGAPHS
ncbi:MAG: LacI family transcriptional regulator [Intrasporangium sp.]|uniref:LacI family DNA-binding transcriptional regulator n=1 Tax=Intrasporangium sp. TaxID=1925024 RepID=UPI0026491586|nr:LacI family DNA-binding transcriptional regulator [Intrasporangium sp.]MDN5796779.1 LacI family transcriptional regulator [Intrasporangium sp.]